MALSSPLVDGAEEAPAPMTMHGAFCKFWTIFKWILLIVLIVLPFAIYHDDVDQVLDSWYAPIMGFVACALPSSGAPIAGGIVFLPILTIRNICTHDAVAFACVVQAFGCAVFAPINWIVKDPSVFVPGLFRITIPPTMVGLFLGYYPLYVEDNTIIDYIFTGFCTLLFIYTTHGLVQNKLNVKVRASMDNAIRASLNGFEDFPSNETDTKDSEAPAPQVDTFKEPEKVGLLPISWKDLAFYWACCIPAGVLTSYIGISIEKVLFVLLTWLNGIHVQKASVSSIVIVGVMSAFASIVHLAQPCEKGAVPFPLFLACLPGILLGSICGPHIARIAGPRNIIIVFAAFLALDVLKSVLGFADVPGFAEDNCIHTPQCSYLDDSPPPSPPPLP